ncbi:MAG: hypothetical protein SFZ23_08050 [Planctomycetota bacterium]|nr:hypothetical protein [Planctomycetota bacterium]
MLLQLTLIGYAPCVALSQIGTASLTWQASLDGGTTWTSNEVQTLIGTSVRIRAVASWSQDAGYSFDLSQFDGTVRGFAGAGRTDAATNFRVPSPLTAGISGGDTYVAQRFADILKIDEVRDTVAPGLGQRSIAPAQLYESAGLPHTTANPLSIFEYTLQLDGSAGTREVSSVWLLPPIGNPVRIRTWRGPSFMDGNNSPETSVVPLRINVVVPAPASAACLMIVASGLARRRRR